MIMIVINEEDIAVGSEFNFKIYNLKLQKCTKTVSGHNGLIRDLLLSNDLQKLFSGSDDKSIKMWDVQTFKCLKTFKGHSHSANKII